MEPFLLPATESWSGRNLFYCKQQKAGQGGTLFLLPAIEGWSGQNFFYCTQQKAGQGSTFFTACNRKLVRAWEQSNLHRYIHNQFLLEIFLCGLDNFHTLKILLFADLFLSFSCRFCTENITLSVYVITFSPAVSDMMDMSKKSP